MGQEHADSGGPCRLWRFETLTESTDRRIADLIREAGRTAAAGSDARKAADYYATFMDEQAIEKLGLRPLEGELARIAATKDRVELARVLGGTLRADVDALNNTNIYTDHVLGVWIAQSLDDPSRYLPFLLQGGLGMPDRTYYLDTSKAMIETGRSTARTSRGCSTSRTSPMRRARPPQSWVSSRTRAVAREPRRL